ncbi:vWA domain-containing protein [Aestuariivirga litoralis]|uniref:vWA domain-containing protein n=1 Tax=Aestuariivirga litoralis TaxID=2650924 RepID=UPI0018C46AB1|nr:vWA domain-containing protein [Aestuariivirga litoralis]MBG1230921.1 VWA domain-containing protein [Aestuariivirga litoralis]
MKTMLKLKMCALPALALGMLATQAQASAGYKRVEVAFVLDSTGSMGDLIEGAKRKIWSIAGSIVDANPQADISMALVTYRDRDDEYVVKTTPLSEDVQGLYGKLLKVEADGGGDTPESVNEALDKAINSLQWTSGPDTRRIVFLVGDAPPHMDYNETKYPAILKEAAQKKIIVNAVEAGDAEDTMQVWKDIAQLGGGRYIPIPQDGGAVVIIETPYDAEILHLQRELDGSVVPYGSQAQKAEITGKMGEKAAAAPSVALDSSSFYAKRSKKEVVTGAGDYVADAMSGGLATSTMADKDLPDELKGKSVAEREAWTKAKVAERGALQDKIAGLVAKRDAFVTGEKSKQPKAARDSFDAVVEDTLKTQLN